VPWFGVAENLSQTEQHAGKQGNDGIKDECARVEGDVVDARKVAGVHGEEQPERSVGEGDPNSATHDAEQQAFREQFSGKAASTRAQGGTDREPGRVILLRERAAQQRRDAKDPEEIRGDRQRLDLFGDSRQSSVGRQSTVVAAFVMPSLQGRHGFVVSPG